MTVKEALECGNMSIDEIISDRERAFKKCGALEMKLGKIIHYLINEGLTFNEIAHILECSELDVKMTYNYFNIFNKM